ncbi:proteobacterial dedicated sortase system histidine kinase [Paraferrimonas sedimenticola]|uniref:histidine kinase n=1 Tax=Paraferrimonas sedimenticola TaxID=375674 RepID=A0AA37W0I0_9GAMM|nr:proteobacterial dedicated sortase system histidine kinase [Paraferrimonas sedimenticola]GLP97914.1 proteobacterial dedicated sortase system histidine kinase [Paraferrimonas sedimenticola]
MRWRLGLIPKVLAVSSFMLLLPVIGYQFIEEMESYLQQGQERTLLGTAQALATALHERPELFDRNAGFLEQVKQGRDLYAHTLTRPIQLDGFLNDWDEQRQHFLRYDGNDAVFVKSNQSAHGLSFEHMIGKYQGYLYAAFEVRDSNPVLRSRNSIRIDRNDLLLIALESPEGEFQRYAVSVTRDGWFNGYRVEGRLRDSHSLPVERRIEGQWLTTDKGYNIELRLPLSMLGSKLAFAIQDVVSADNPQVARIIGTANPHRADQIGSVLVPSPEIDRIIKGMQHSQARLWVVDRHQRVLARSGDIYQSDGVWAQNPQRQPKSDDFWSSVYQRWLEPRLDTWLTRPSQDFVDTLNDTTQLDSNDITKALQGLPQSSWRLTPDNKATILTATHPIYVDGQVMGAVVAEATTNGIRSLRNTAMQNLFKMLAWVILLGLVMLLFFAGGLSWRIRRLRNQTEAAIDDNGRVTTQLELSKRQDEIGDLSRSFSQVLERLAQHNQYLEQLASRLSHELRTPVAVVRSSLENLSSGLEPERQAKVIDRAQEGITRLNRILASMTEASRLEQSLQSMELEPIALNDLVEGYCQGYRMAYPNQNFELVLPKAKVMVQGQPEYLGQLLDKLIANACEFSEAGKPVVIELARLGDTAKLVVSNSGPLLPDTMSEELFSSMVSVRAKTGEADKPHLGLGLYIVQLISDYHKGRVSIANRKDGSGVEVSLLLPASA